MKESQAEIRAIQVKLQALQMGRSPLRPPSELPSEPAASNQPTATMGKAPSDIDPELEGIPEALSETLQQRRLSSLNKHHLSESSAPPESTRKVRPKENAAGQRQAVMRPPAEASTRLIPSAQPLPAMTEAVQRLESQAERINQLSLDQEAALLELKAIAEQIERNRKGLGSDRDDEQPTWEYLSAAVPLVERDETGTFVVTTRSVDLYQAERDAVLMAQSLRSRSVAPGYRVRRPARRQPAAKPAIQTAIAEGGAWGQLIWQKIQELLPARRPARLRRQPDPAPLTVQDAALWIIGAIVARRGLDLLLAAFPHLWLPVVALIVTPAAIAIYRTTFTPESGFAWGYRLFLVMIGLLIGGRL